MKQNVAIALETPAGNMLSFFTATLRRLLAGAVPHRRERSLRLRESLSLGEKRFLAVVQFEQQQFLVGGAGSSISLLTQLPSIPLPDGLQPGSPEE